MFLRGKGRRVLWLPGALVPREVGRDGTPGPPEADEPEPFSHNEANRILDEVWSTIELTWAPEEDLEETPPRARAQDSLPDPDSPESEKE